MMDFEKAAINVFKEEFSNSRLQGSFFHFSQAIYRHDQSAIQNVQDYFNHLVEKPEIVLEDAHHPSLLPQFSFCITSSENIAQFQERLSYNLRTLVLTSLYEAVSSCKWNNMFVMQDVVEACLCLNQRYLQLIDTFELK
jgi:hypothetical protein